MTGTHLIVGGDGTIGKALAAFLAAQGLSVVSTTRRADSVSADRVLLDLGTAPDGWTIPDDVAVCYLCAAMARQGDCEAEPDAARRINVAAPLELARRVVSQGGFVVFLSTDSVFGGMTPLPQAATPTSPLTTYGRLKADAELALQSLPGGAVTILRLTKVVYADMALFETWRQAYRDGGVVEAFEDMVFAPVPLSGVVRFLHALGENRPSGVYQYSATHDISYTQAAEILLEPLGGTGRVQGTSWRGKLTFTPPQRTALGMGVRERALGFTPPQPEDVLAEMANG